MILEVLARDFEQAALLYPLRRSSSVAGYQTTNVPNPFVFGNHSPARASAGSA